MTDQERAEIIAFLAAEGCDIDVLRQTDDDVLISVAAVVRG